jgi:hypothetical protein
MGKKAVLITLDEDLLDRIDAHVPSGSRSSWINDLCEEALRREARGQDLPALLANTERPAEIEPLCQDELIDPGQPSERPKRTFALRPSQAQRLDWEGRYTTLVSVRCQSCGQRWKAPWDALEAGVVRCPALACQSDKVSERDAS